MRKRWKMKKLPLAMTMMILHIFFGITLRRSSPTVASAATAAATVRNSVNDAAEINVLAGLYNPTSFQASPSCVYTFGSLKIHNTVRGFVCLGPLATAL